MVSLNLAALESITPNAQTVYRQAFENASALEPFGVLDSSLRAGHFLAQVLHETGGLRLLVENLSYSPQRLMEVWPHRFPTRASALPFARNSRKLANAVYGGRNGNVEPNDGWRFIGRGLLQLTGRKNYARVGFALRLDLVGCPTLVLDPAQALRVAGCAWADLARANEPADLDNLEMVTKAINGGMIGLEERRAWLQKVREHHVVLE